MSTTTSEPFARHSRSSRLMPPAFPHRAGAGSPPARVDLPVHLDFRSSPREQTLYPPTSYTLSSSTSPSVSPPSTKRRIRYTVSGSSMDLPSPRSSTRSVATVFSTSPGSTPVSFGARSSSSSSKIISESQTRLQSREARRTNDDMVYLEGPQVYACCECRTHLSTHDHIISKSFHGRHGRAYLLDECVNVTTGPSEDRRLLTGLHSVCDIFCKRCNTLVGWTYKRAYEPSQKYKEGKFIVEKIHLHLEEDSPLLFDEDDDDGRRKSHSRRSCSWRKRSLSWSSTRTATDVSSASVSSPTSSNSMVYEY